MEHVLKGLRSVIDLLDPSASEVKVVSIIDPVVVDERETEDASLLVAIHAKRRIGEIDVTLHLHIGDLRTLIGEVDLDQLIFEHCDLLVALDGVSYQAKALRSQRDAGGV